MKQYGYLYGNPGRRKMRSPWYADKFTRNSNAAADKANGFRVRLVEREAPGGKHKPPSTTV